ncbi:MAG: thioredoxin domain-containing protein [Proteobacteria bacterium]|nr:thioredoxin domain-containing protein [Pseudomonadota bacterium]
MTQNRLAGETSPYLLQHAHNPVDWNPWGPEALQSAKGQNKPILLSIGYAACHWCHVMAHESFENGDIAALMNELFVNIKVDREERPDLDAIYMHSLTLLGQQGGWPLTMFLTPDGEPFWGGTYFPPEARYGRPGFPDILRTIHEYWRDKPDDIAQNVATLRGAIANMATSKGGGEVSLEVVERAALRLAQEFDKVNGGIGTAPKFPNPSILELLWRTYKRCGHIDLRDTVLLTLEKMCQGGIYDHLGGGFARYSVDALWLAPHFEKMLYDNAQLIDLLTWAWQETGNPLFAARVRETIDWTMREMIADGGGFAATLDADSEGEEGKFYVWSAAEIDAILGPDAALFKDAYDIRPAGNWEGKTILNRNNPVRDFTDQEEETLTANRTTLLAARDKRIRPGWDDKVLADWNGLMIAAMAEAGAVFDQPDWIATARTAYAFVHEHMVRDGRIFHSFRNGLLKHVGTLDDYAGMIRAALVLSEITGEAGYLEDAESWTALLDRHYWDKVGGGYFFTADDAEALIVRTKTAADHATPAGNGVMVAVLARLYYLTGKDAYRTKADVLVAAFSGEVSENFFPLAAFMSGIEMLQCGQQLVIVGDRQDPKSHDLLRGIFAACLPNRILTVIAPDDVLPATHPASGKAQKGGVATAYVCVGTTCSLPLTDRNDLMEAL